MKTFEQLTIKQVWKEIVYWETGMGSQAKTVEVASVGQKPDNRPYKVDGHACEEFRATVKVDGKIVARCYEWDRDDEGISLGWNEEKEQAAAAGLPADDGAM